MARPTPSSEIAATKSRVLADARFPCFDGLRALAAVAIVVHHTAFWTTGGTSVWSPYYAELTVGVYVFFVISGFLLYRPYVASHHRNVPAGAVRPFLRRRFLRLYPAYWVALVLSLYVLPTHFIEFSGPGEAVANFALVQRYFGSMNILAGLPQAWTLVTEVSFYVFLPAYAWLLARLVRRFELAGELAALGGLVVVGLVVQLLSIYAGPIWAPLNVLPFYAPVFAVGMLLAVLSVWVTESGRIGALTRFAGRSPAAWWLLALAVFVATAELGKAAGEDRSDTVVFTTVWAHTLIGLLLVVPAVFGAQDHGLVRRFLRSRPWAYLGLVSYGIYLWHPTIGALIRDRWWDVAGASLDVWQLLLPVLIGTVIAATLSYYVVERPFIRLSRHRAARPGN
jgi:peptidoglycan/LPS O-acetylase OafA/YrhL